jgi:type IX secretion system PorP/SprF family membrane protein
MRKYCTFLMIIFCAYHTHAQQEAQYTQFMYNNLAINPGFTGSRRLTSINVLYRNQWIGFKGNPNSYVLSFDMPFPKSPKLGVGLISTNQA